MMARGQTKQRGRGAAKREQIIEAALATLIELGFSRTSTRAIAARGGFNQALIHYHFGSMNALWLAVIDHRSAIRMDRYKAAIAQASTLEEMVEVAISIYREDLESGQMTMICELVGASLSEPELAEGIVERMQPWISFVEDVIKKVLAGSPFGSMIPTREAAASLVAFYLGVNVLTRLEADRSNVDALFDTARRLAPLLSPLLSAQDVRPGER